MVIRGTVTDDAGRPLAGATLDCWQNATAGFYAVQQPGVQSADNLRGIYTTDEDGSYEIRTVRPVPYPIPFDGPVGDLLRANGRNWMRPGHTHMWARAEGYKDLITHVFDAETDYLHDDAVFGVRPSLVRGFVPDADGELAATFDVVLDRVAVAKGRRACPSRSRRQTTLDESGTPSLLYLIGRIDRVVRRHIDEVVGNYGLSVSQYTTLSVLERRSGLSNAQLARRSLVSPQSMNEVLLSLERRGLVRRSAHPAHGRILQARLTAKGRRLLAACDAGVREVEAAHDERPQRPRRGGVAARVCSPGCAPFTAASITADGVRRRCHIDRRSPSCHVSQ